MNLTLIIGAIGIFVLVSTFIETRKYMKNMEELVKIQKCKEITYYKKPMIAMFLLSLVCALCAYFGFTQKNDSMMNVGLLLCFMFLAETYRSYFVARIYYNNEGIIANDRFIKFKSIKTMYKNSSTPFSKWTIMTFSNEKVTIISTLAHFIEDNFKDKIPAPKQKSK